ncbi:MAG: putative transcriptional regulator [Bacteroidetes bacterium]|nr:putative transcriptional regulator [Bacteroidota bacterium]
MHTLGEQLRRAREAQGLSINQIEEITLINARHLEAIERGDLDTLPRPYIRAFVREYAALVGLDPDALLQQLDTRKAEREGQPDTPDIPDDSPEAQPTQPVASRLVRSSTVRIAGVVVLLLVGTIALVVLNEPAPVPDVREIPFGNVIRENEQRLAPPQQPAPATPAPAASDSLTLSAAVTDSVWIQIVVDNLPPREYLARAGFRRSWKARERFVVTVGNAGAAAWTLNGTKLGPLGRTGTVARNVELNRASLTRR